MHKIVLVITILLAEIIILIIFLIVGFAMEILLVVILIIVGVVVEVVRLNIFIVISNVLLWKFIVSVGSKLKVLIFLTEIVETFVLSFLVKHTVFGFVKKITNLFIVWHG